MFDPMALDKFIARGGIALGCNLAFADCVELVKSKENVDDAAARKQAIALPRAGRDPAAVRRVRGDPGAGGGRDLSSGQLTFTRCLLWCTSCSLCPCRSLRLRRLTWRR